MIAAVKAKAADDPAFAAKVEASVQRVVTLKERMGLLPCSTTQSAAALAKPGVPSVRPGPR